MNTIDTIDGIGLLEKKSNPADDMAIDYSGKILYDMYKAMSMFIRDFKRNIRRLICNMSKVL